MRVEATFSDPKAKRPGGSVELMRAGLGCVVVLVAGTGFEPVTFRL